jgi:hypothetical protein
MSYKPQSFQARVNYAIDIIVRKAPACRTFDACFENWDGDVVAAAILRRAEHDPVLAENYGLYLSRKLGEQAALRFAIHSDEDLKRVAAKYRREGRASLITNPARPTQLALF